MAKKYKVVCGGWADTKEGMFYPRGSVVELEPRLAAKFLNAFEVVEDPKAKVSDGKPINAERDETLADEPPTAEVVEVAELPEGAEDASDMFPNETNTEVYQLAEGGFLVRSAGHEDKTFADTEEIQPYLDELQKAHDDKPAPAKPATKKKNKGKGK